MTTRTIRLAVTGATAQVVTETLYRIHQPELEWPDEIVMSTTSVGKEQARLNVLIDGKLKALCDEYDKPLPEFSDQHIRVFPDAQGHSVAVAPTLEDQQALADFAMLAAFARAKHEHRIGFYRQPKHDSEHIAYVMLKERCLLEGVTCQPEHIFDTLDQLLLHNVRDAKTVEALEKNKKKPTHNQRNLLEFDMHNFSDRRNSLQKLLCQALPKAAVNLLLPQTHGQNNPYQSLISADNITFTSP